MVQHFKSYLRPFRRRWGFTQKELAFLLGLKTGKAISRIEALQQTPALDAIFSCVVIFNVPPSRLFPAILSDAEQAVFPRVRELYDELQGNSSKATRIKLDFLEALLARLERRRGAAT